MNSFTALYFITPIILTALAIVTLYFGLRNRAFIQWRFVIVSCLLLLIVCADVIWVASSGGLGGAIAFLLILYGSGIALIFSVGLAIGLPGKRKLVGVILPVLFPVVLFVGLQVGDSRSWESITQANGNDIAKALEQYRTAQGRYPKSLNDLVPKFISDLRTPQTVWGWLYQSTDSDYSLGFVESVGRFPDYTIYIHQSANPGWHYLLSSGPFELGPTPMYVPVSPTP